VRDRVRGIRSESGGPCELRDGPTGRGTNDPGIEQGGPAWWLNLQADPEATVEMAGRPRREVHGRVAVGEERARLWQRWRDLDKNLDGYAARRPNETAVVVLEPRA
jgi:F420H(2)-dependent quinone reductase